MLNRKQYEQDLEKAKKQQIQELTDRLTEAFDVNANIRRQPEAGAVR